MNVGKSSQINTKGKIKMDILDAYVKSAPSSQNSIDIFKSEWSSSVPDCDSGHALLFEDSRIQRLIQKAGGVTDKKILELGPLEGGHTFMLDKAGAASITSIESNQRAYLKCLITKEILNYKSKTLLGDFIPYLEAARKNDEKYDFILASGVLYHLVNPIMVIDHILSITKQVGIWTQYYDRQIVQRKFGNKFSSNVEVIDYKGVKIEMCRQEYEGALNWPGFCGGSAPFSYWLTKESFLNILKINGFVSQVLDDDPEFQNGPCMLLYAEKL